MNPSITTKLIAAAALAVAALGAASAAHARSDVYVSFSVPGAPVYMEPAPVYTQPRPVYVQPQPVYVQPRPVYAQPRPVYMQPPAYGGPAEMYGARPCPPAYDAGYEEERAWRRAEWRRRHWRHHHQEWNQYQSRNRDWND